MCDSSVAAIIESVVSQFCQQGKMFTALDVSRTVQQQHGVRERHMNMKNEVHRLFADGAMVNPASGKSYRRTTITLPGVPVPPWLYYEDGSDPTQYVSQYTGQTPQAVLPPPPPTPAPSANDGNDDEEDDDGATKADPDGVYHSDKRGRVWVPVQLIAAIGAAPGSVVYAVKGNVNNEPCLGIKRVLAPTDSEGVAYKVDRHGNIAVSRGCLMEAGISSGSPQIDPNNGNWCRSFSIEGDSSMIVIKAATASAQTAQASCACGAH